MKTAEIEQMQVKVSDIQTAVNYRRHMDPTKLKELAENVRKFGILEPVLVRKDEKGQLILIAGHRRLAAAQAAGLKEIPARLLDVDQKQADEIQVLENLHREDLSPVDEARAFKSLLDLGKHNVETLAAHVDKSVAYVFRSLRLLDLPEKGLKALEEGVITTGHAHQILRAPEKHTEALLKYVTTLLEWQKRYATVDELKQYIAKTIEKDLAGAPFPKDVAYAGEIACTGCPFNTGNQGALFDGAIQGHCTNPGCFNKKTAAHYKELEALGAKRFPGLSYLGSASADYSYGPRQIKGAYVVDKLTEKLREAMAKDPGQFGFGILKPARWGGDKKPILVLLCKNAKLAGVKAPKREEPRKEQTPEEREREEFIRNHVEASYYRLAVEKVEFDKTDLLAILQQGWDEEWMRRKLAQFMGAAGVGSSGSGEFPADALEKKSRDTLIQVVMLWWGENHGLDVGALLKRRKVDIQAFIQKAQAEGKTLWEGLKKKAA